MLTQEFAKLARIKFNQMEQWLYSCDTITREFNFVENGVETNGRELLRLMLQAYIENRGIGDVGNAIMVIHNGMQSRYSSKRIDVRSIITVFGKVRIRRTGYYCAGHRAIHPLDEQMQLPHRLYSYEVQRRVVKMAVQGPFDEAIDVAVQNMGLRLPKRSVEELLVNAADDFDSFYARRSRKQHYPNDPIVVASVDCKGIPMVKAELAQAVVRRGKGQKAQKKKMATVAAVFTQQPCCRTPRQVVDSLFRCENKSDKSSRRQVRCHDKRIWASLTASKDAFITDVIAETKRRNTKGTKTVVAVTDGERALQLRIGQHMKGATLILDLAHVLEKLWAAAHVFHEEGSLDAQAFVRKRALRVLEGKVGQVVKGLRAMVTKRSINGQKKNTILKAAKYLYKNRLRMRYDLYLEKGLPIASGSVEGACKNLIKDRMERSGMRWTKKMAEAMVKMRALYLSGDFDEYWNYHIEQDQKKLYAVKWKPVHAK